MMAPSKKGKAASGQVGGLPVQHYERVLEQVREGCLGFIRQLSSQVTNELIAYLPRVQAVIMKIHQINIKGR